MTIIFRYFSTEINWETTKCISRCEMEWTNNFINFCLFISWHCIEAVRLLMLQTNFQTIRYTHESKTAWKCFLEVCGISNKPGRINQIWGKNALGIQSDPIVIFMTSGGNVNFTSHIFKNLGYFNNIVKVIVHCRIFFQLLKHQKRKITIRLEWTITNTLMYLFSVCFLTVVINWPHHFVSRVFQLRYKLKLFLMLLKKSVDVVSLVDA